MKYFKKKIISWNFKTCLYLRATQHVQVQIRVFDLQLVVYFIQAAYLE